MSIEAVVAAQRAFFATHATKEVEFRLRALQKLEEVIRARTADIEVALGQDLGKSNYEGYMTEIGTTLEELAFVRKHTRKWAKDKRAKSSLVHFPSKCFVHHEPYGVALVMAPWNYPFLLSMEPLIGAVAAGNCVVLKPSAYSPATSTLMREICEEVFPPQHVAVVEGGRAENTALLEQRFDYIFFTGSVDVGRLVMAKASVNLTPVSLELGGKSPCILDQTADLKVAGRRIAFGKYLNAGQTCIAPDYLLVQHSVAEALLGEIQDAVQEFFGEDPIQSTELPKIINAKHFERLQGLMKDGNIYFGGNTDGAERIAPTLITDITPDSPIMQEEIFGPILPVMTFDVMDTAISFVNSREKPLALYLFTNDTQVEKDVLNRCSYGGGCVNDTIVHLATTSMGFGGVGNSGMGSYHGKRSFDTFTHEKSILKKGNWLDLDIRYHPYTKTKEKLLHFVMK